MECPKCQQTMDPENIGLVEIDHCTHCDGIWFDKDELRQAKDARDPDLKWMDFELWKHEDQFRLLSHPTTCPNCSNNMVQIDYGNTGVTIDHCPGCGGVWLASGAFQNIVDALEEELLSKNLSEYLAESLKEASEIITGPEGLISEWKDFATVLRMMEYRVFSGNPGLAKMILTMQRDIPLR